MSLVALKRAVRRAQYRHDVRQSRRQIAPPTERIPDRPGEIRLFAKARNESTRWPWFLQHYRGIGVDRFFVVDNGSTDGFLDVALTEPDVHVFTTNEPLERHPLWFEVLLGNHGVGHWCLAADLDELLVLPPDHGPGLRDAVAQLEQGGTSALDAVLLDLYPAGPLAGADYAPGSDPLAVLDHFDPAVDVRRTRPLNERTQQRFDATRYGGGPRARHFGVDPNLTKVPLFLCREDTWLSAGAHHLDGAAFGDARAVMLHLKYLHDAVERTVEAAERAVYADAGGTVSAAAATLLEQPGMSFVHEGSAHLDGIGALFESGLLRNGQTRRGAVSAH